MPEAWPSDDQILSALTNAMWGDLSPRDQNVVVHFSSLNTPWTLDRSLLVTLRIHPHRRMWAGKRFQVAGQDVGIQKTISDRALYMSSVEVALGGVLREIIDMLPREVAPRLFEADPRIGSRVVVGSAGGGLTEHGTPHPGGQWTRCPLFDPPGGVYVPFPKPDLETERTSTHFKRWSTCGKCKRPFDLGEEVTWAGGYLLWACHACSSDPASVVGL